jgi:hypothetical protein
VSSKHGSFGFSFIFSSLFLAATAAENSLGYACFSERDWQCDFDNPFWEESDCNWKYSQSLSSVFGFAAAAPKVRFVREEVTGTENGYWKRTDGKTRD